MVRIGTIGGPETFAGQATTSLVRMFPYLSTPTYFASGPAMFEALRSGTVDAVIGAASNLGGDTEMAHMLVADDAPLYVAAEAQLPFGCQLLGAPGASLADVRLVHGGPASIAQAGVFLKEHLPGAAAAIYVDPLATGERVARCDGSEAVLGTLQLARRFGLSLLAADVDGGVVNGNWWALARAPRFDPAPRRLIVTARWQERPALGQLLAEVGQAGFALASITVLPTREHLFEAHHLLRFAGTGSLAGVERAIAAVVGTRLKSALPDPQT